MVAGSEKESGSRGIWLTSPCPSTLCNPTASVYQNPPEGDAVALERPAMAAPDEKGTADAVPPGRRPGENQQAARIAKTSRLDYPAGLLSSCRW
jgi:hypothetical protein